MQQLGPFVIVGAIVTNLAILLGFGLLVPRWLRRQDTTAAAEAMRLREMLIDVLSEQEAVTLRQQQIGASLNSMQEQLGKLNTGGTLPLAPDHLAVAAGIPELQSRLDALQRQLGATLEQGAQLPLQTQQRVHVVDDSQQWSGLLALLATMQDNIATLNAVVAQPQHTRLAADHLLLELDDEMQHLRMLADEVAGLQWKLRRSVRERESSLASLRAQLLHSPQLGNRAA